MNIKCDYCGSMIDERSESCPHCGAKLSGVNRLSTEQPKTIEELQAWYTAHNLPPEEITRFFIGKNITEPKAFGIYKTETGDCVVYKNKSTGERAIRYQGADEGYAVNELYQRLKAEIADQKAAHGSPKQPKKNKKTAKGCLIALIVFIILGVVAVAMDKSAPNGYYNYDNTEYYHQGSSWYRYDKDADNWVTTTSMSDIITKDNAGDYSYNNHEGMRFEETSWYDDGSSDDSDDWDSDNSWDSDDDWSSSSTDWDSDW